MRSEMKCGVVGVVAAIGSLLFCHQAGAGKRVTAEVYGYSELTSKQRANTKVVYQSPLQVVREYSCDLTDHKAEPNHWSRRFVFRPTLVSTHRLSHETFAENAENAMYWGGSRDGFARIPSNGLRVRTSTDYRRQEVRIALVEHKTVEGKLKWATRYLIRVPVSKKSFNVNLNDEKYEMSLRCEGFRVNSGVLTFYDDINRYWTSLAITSMGEVLE